MVIFSMKLQKFKERNNKQKSIIIFTIACVILITGVFLYKTFASFEVIKNEDLINGDVNDPGDIYFAFYKDNKIQKEMPTKEQGYVLDEEKSYCGVTGGNNSDIKVHVTENDMIFVSGVTTSRTKCNLYFVKGAYILGKGVPTVESGEGLYEVTHNDNDLDEKWKPTEYRYAGKSPDNHIKFNDEDWRIIGLVNVMIDESHIEQRVKIIKEESIGNFSWSGTNTRDWSESTLQQMLNGSYYNNSTGECWTGDYMKPGSSSQCDFSGNNTYPKGLKDVQNMIEKVIWNTGYFEITNPYTPEGFYLTEIKNSIGSKELRDVGLISPSDYLFAAGGEKRATCLQSAYFVNNQCYEEDYFYNEQGQWTIFSGESVNTDGSFSAKVVRGTVPSEYTGNIGGGGQVLNAWPVHPVVYLKEDIKITNGNGMKDSPWILSEINLF